jgi:hypothetical protein
MKILKFILLTLFFLIIVYVGYVFTQNHYKQKLQEEKEVKSSSDNKSHKSNSLVENLEVEVDNLNFTSKTDKNEIYNIKAEKSQKNKSGQYIMDNIVANIEFEDGNFQIKSDGGSFDENSNYLMLQNNINGHYKEFLISGDLFEFYFEKNELISNARVSLSNEKINIKADSMIANDEKIIMEGNVKTIINSN